MKKTIILALTFLFLLSTAGMASAADFSLTLKALGIRPSIEAGMYLGDNLEATFGFDYVGDTYSYSGTKVSGHIIEISPGIRYYYNKSGKLDSFFLGRLTKSLYGGDYSSPEENIFVFTGGLGFAYNIDPRFAVVTEAGLLWYSEKLDDWSYNEKFTIYSIGFKYIF